MGEPRRAKVLAPPGLGGRAERPAREPAERDPGQEPLAPLLARPRLETVLDGVLAHRLALVVADAGSGKTTLLSSWARGINAVVHDVGPGDAELHRCARHVVAAVRQRVPGLSLELPGGTEADAAPAGAGTALPDALAELVAAGLSAHLQRDTVLVLDNVHVIGDGPSMSFLDSLIRNAPPLLHLVLASRSDPPVAVDRLRSQGEVVELYGADLAFTEAEVAELLGTVLGPGSTGLARPVLEASAGWPAAVRLSVEALREVEPDERAARLDTLTEGDAVARVAAAVFERETEESQRLLACVGLFDEVCAGLLQAVAVDEGGALAELTRRGLFLEPGASGSGWYRLHALAAEAIAGHDPLPAGEAAQIRRAAAEWFIANDLPHLALRSLTAAGYHAEVVALLERSGQQLLSQGNTEDVIAAVTALPLDARDVAVERLAGEAYQLQGLWDKALACYERATPAGGRTDAGLAWRTGLIHYLRGDPAGALAAYEQADPDDGEPSQDRALLLAWQASAHWGTGDAARCGAIAVEALRIADAVDDPQALAAAHTILGMLAALEGDPRANNAHYLKALQQAERAQDLFQLVRIHTNRGSHLMEQGAYLEALEELDRAITLADLSGLAGFGALALHNRGEARLGLGRLEEAQSDFETSAAIFDELGSGMMTYPLRGLGTVHRLRGDSVSARASFERALELAEAAGDAQGRVPALSGLARLLAEEDPRQAAELADAAVAAGPGMNMVGALLASAWVALAEGDRVTARRQAVEAAGAAEARRDRPGLAEALTVQAATTEDSGEALALAGRSRELWSELDDPIGLAEAELMTAERLDEVAAGVLLGSVQARMRAVGCRLLERRAATLLARLGQAGAPGLRIETLGGFRVLRGGRVVPSSAWKSRQARDLVKLLVSRRGRAVSREQLMELFWPEQTAEEIGNRLNVVLSTVRSVVDPDRELGPDGAVVTDGDAIRLDLDVVTVDIEEFLADAWAGLRLLREQRDAEGLEYLVRAEACYRGDFAEEDPYADWTAPLREEARATYREVVAHLARHSRDDGDLDATIRYLLRGLEHDPFDERTHLQLVSALADSGRHGDARRQYRLYCARMEELGVEPASFSLA